MSENIVSVNNLSVAFDYQENFLAKKQKIKAVNNINIKIELILIEVPQSGHAW